MNHPIAERVATNKIFQLRVAKRLGFIVPATLITNDPDEAISFREDIGQVVFKALSGYQPSVPLENEYVFTQEFTKDKFDVLDSLRWAPAIFQERIMKRYDIRCTVVGAEIVACRIHSQARADTAIDFRVMGVTGSLHHDIIRLPLKVEEKIRAMMRKMRLAYGCIDLVEDRNGDFYFLEVNPVGQWLWIENLTGAPISKLVAHELSRQR